MLRFPISLIDEDVFAEYVGTELSWFWKTDEHLILSFRLDDEEPDSVRGKRRDGRVPWWFDSNLSHVARRGGQSSSDDVRSL
jgi:hypothetical protein